MSTSVSSRKLTVDDILDARAYERVRDSFRAAVIDLKHRRRVHLGTIVSLVFENRDTMRWQVQEMARVERIFTDEGIQEELDVYNPMIPEPGQLCATLFLELTNDDQMREWLGRLVGIERSILFRLPDGSEVRCGVEASHASQLTREHVTAAVHFIDFTFTPQQVEAFTEGTQLVIDHPDYLEVVELAPFTLAELRSDLVASQ
jgi:hypothetical protein